MSGDDGRDEANRESPVNDDRTEDNRETTQFSNEELALPSETADYQISDVFAQLERLEATVTSEAEQREVERTRRILKAVPGSDHIRKYTTRDIGEAFVGGIIFALPLLVEGGVFEIAEWFTEITVAGVPVFLVVNVAFILTLTTGLLYAIDFRTVKITNPIFGFIPRRLVGVLMVSLLVAAGTMLMWGRLHEEDPTNLEVVARVTVVWAAAALGAVLGDILPGESKGRDISTIIGDED